MEQFAGYGFNKSHSAAYALLAYHTAYLKTHYPVEFMAALAELGNFQAGERRQVHQGVPRDGHRRRAPGCADFRRGLHARVVSAIRFGLTAIKNVGRNAIDSILQARRDSRERQDFGYVSGSSARRWICA